MCVCVWSSLVVSLFFSLSFILSHFVDFIIIIYENILFLIHSKKIKFKLQMQRLYDLYCDLNSSLSHLTTC